MKVAILGGSFNPIHNGHLDLASKTIAYRLADEVWVMPCKKHALDKVLDRVEDRVAMVELALQGLERIKLCDLEIKSSGKCYTFETLRSLRQIYPANSFSWIMCSDILQEISRWYGYESLQKEASFIVFNREGYPATNPGINIEATIDSPGRISSTEIRRRVKNGKPITGMAPKAVEDYILQNGLYKK
jgi:nicotinate-nucleotide adenylyltransferase